MRTKAYVCGVEKVNGHDAWALFEACALGDQAKSKSLLAKDRRLVNAQYWYQFPIHMAVRGGHADSVRLLLDQGANPGQSNFTYDSWDKLLNIASERGHRRIESLLMRAMTRRFNYAPDFDELKAAIIARDPRKTRTVIRRNPRLARASDALGNNALHWSVITRQLPLITQFVELGTPIDAQRADGQTPVLLAVNGAMDYWYRAERGKSHPSLRNSSVLVGSLLASGASYTISVAAAVGDQERVEEILAMDPSLAGRLDSARVSPLSYAAREGHAHIVRLLLKHGANPNLPEALAPNGQALYQACCGNHVEIVQLLLDHGANPNAGVDSCECCLTIGRIYHGSRAKPIEQLLLRHGAYKPPYYMSAKEMMQAIRERHAVVRDEEFLGNLMRKRNLKLLDLYIDSDPTVPHRLQHWGSITYPQSPILVRRLLARGLDPNVPDWLGRTFLHACAANGDRSIAAILLDAGASIDAKDIESNATPLASAVQCACSVGNSKLAERGRRMVEFLLKRGAATNLPGDKPWSTPLSRAIRHGHTDIAKLLKEHGAT
jgi:uncharacterized protein